MVLPDEMIQPLPAEWMDQGEPIVVIHGDLSVQNVQVEADGESLVILDFSMSPRLAIPGTVGPRTIDLAWFGRNLFFKERPWRAWSNRPGDEMIVFLSAYFMDTGFEPHIERLAAGLAELNARFSRLVRDERRIPRWRLPWYLQRAQRYGAFLRSRRFSNRLIRAIADN
jgi:hypothetical protein